MKQIKRYLPIACLFPLLFSCEKDNTVPSISPTGSDTLTILSKKWKVVKDSVVNENYANPWGGSPIPGVYYGMPNDYYLFDSSYNITMFENNHFLTGKYKLLANSQFLIDVTRPTHISTIKSINNLSAIFDWELYNGNGRYFRRLTLAK